MTDDVPTNDNVWVGDVLQRRKYATFLTQYLADKKTSFVININAPWGSGKSFFLEKWHEDVKKVHPSVLFNAWENDFSNDPLLSVISCIDSCLLPLLPNDNENSSVVENIYAGSGRLLKSVAPILAKAAAAKIIGKDGMNELANISLENEKTTTEVIGKLTEELVKNNKATEKAVDDFKTSLSVLVDRLTDDKKKPPLKNPLFIFIDELDRCRPLYAIELLERIKHLFGSPGVVFVIATDTDQLKHSVKSIYGSGFDSSLYLRRFFDQTYYLPAPNVNEYSKLLFLNFESSKKYFRYSISASGNSELNSRGHTDEYVVSDQYTLKTDKTEYAELILIFTMFSDYFGLDLRTQNQCYEKILAIVSAFSDEDEIHFSYLTYLVMLEARNTEMFDQYFGITAKPSHKIKDIIADKYSSSLNVRIRNGLVTPQDFIDFYSKYAFYSIKDITKSINDRKETREDWLRGIQESIASISKYKEKVMLASELS